MSVLRRSIPKILFKNMLCKHNANPHAQNELAFSFSV